MDGGTARRLDDYALKKGRLVMGGHHAPAKAKPKGSSRSSTRSASASQKLAAEKKRRRQRASERDTRTVP